MKAVVDVVTSTLMMSPSLMRCESGDAVADDLVDRGAHALREAVVVERRRAGASAQRVLVDEAVDLVGGHARADERRPRAAGFRRRDDTLASGVAISLGDLISTAFI